MSRFARAFVKCLGAPLRCVEATGTADAIVILGSPLLMDGQLSRVGEERVKAGVELFFRGAAPIICVTGGSHTGRAGGRPEAEAMAERALSLGVPGHTLVVEPEAQTTHENAVRVRQCLPACKRVWLVTQSFHSRRARWLFRRQGFDARVWCIENSLEFHAPRKAAVWIVREYAAWAKLALNRLPKPRKTSE